MCALACFMCAAFIAVPTTVTWRVLGRAAGIAMLMSLTFVSSVDKPIDHLWQKQQVPPLCAAVMWGLAAVLIGLLAALSIILSCTLLTLWWAVLYVLTGATWCLKCMKCARHSHTRLARKLDNAWTCLHKLVELPVGP